MRRMHDMREDGTFPPALRRLSSRGGQPAQVSGTGRRLVAVGGSRGVFLSETRINETKPIEPNGNRAETHAAAQNGGLAPLA